jgi:hypothetical protein
MKRGFIFLKIQFQMPLLRILKRKLGMNISHYQKINKYKRKYRGNISVGKFPRDFIEGIIPSVYTEGITMGNKIKTKHKK